MFRRSVVITYFSNGTDSLRMGSLFALSWGCLVKTGREITISYGVIPYIYT